MNSKSSPRLSSAASAAAPLQGAPQAHSLRSPPTSEGGKDAPGQHAHNYQRSIQSYLEQADRKASETDLRDGRGPGRTRDPASLNGVGPTRKGHR